MDALGVWKIRNAQQFDAATMKLVDKNVDDILADTSIPEDEKQMLRAKFIFKDDGYVYTALPVPEEMPQEEIDEYLASGEAWLVDGLLGIERKEWKEEDGKLLVETDDGFEEAPATENGFEVFHFFRIVKM